MTNTNDLKALLDSIPTPPPQGWERVKLGDISIKITKGTTPTTIGFSFLDKGINFVKVESITESGAFIPHKMAYVSKECYDKLERSQLQENDILFSIAGALGRVAVVTKEILPANTNQALAIVRLKPNANKTHFIRVALHTNDIEKQIDSFKKGIAQQNLSLEQVENLKIPLPPIEAQEKIVSAIDSVESQIAHIDSKLEMLEKTKAEILANALNANNEREREREREQIKLKEILSEIESLLSQRKILQHFITKILQKAGLTQSLESLIDSLPTPSTQGYPQYRLNDKSKFSLQIGKRVLDSELNPQGQIPVFSANVKKPFGFIDKELLKDYEKDSVLWGIDGDWMVGFIPKNTPFYPTDHCGVLQVNDKDIKAKIVSFLLDEAGKKAGFSRNLRASIERIGNVKIPLPPIEEQEKIISVIESVENKITLFKEQSQTFEDRKMQVLKSFLVTGSAV